MIFNELQTQITEEQLNNFPKYVKEELIDALENIPFIKNLTSVNRPRIRDLKKDKYGRIVVNITNPHILEDMDYFRQSAIHFQKHNCYTFATPLRIKDSEFQQFWRKEKEYCLKGKLREDGEWISGYYYFYLNYSPILLTRPEEELEEVNIEKLIDDYVEQVLTDSVRSERIHEFPDVWDGDYLFFHYVEQGELAGRYGVTLKTRGRGYSFKINSMLARNYTHIPQSKSYAFASEGEYLTKDGLLNKTWDTLGWINTKTAWTKRLIIDQGMHKKSGYKDLATQTEKGYLSEVIGVTLKNEPERARGKRGKLIVYEEAGKFPGLVKAWGIARPSIEDGRYTFGYMIAFGTGGSAGVDFEGIEELFYKGKAHRVLQLQNVFDKNAQQSTCAFYHGEYLNRKGCYDKNGNSDVVKALIEIFQDRWEVIDSNSSPNAIVQEKADRSVTPQEACMRTEGNLFPVEELKNYLADIMPNLARFQGEHSVGDLLTSSDGNVVFKPNPTKQPCIEFPIKDNKNKEGAIEIFKHPVKINGQIPRLRYIAGIDSYDNDESTTTSLGSIFIFDLWTDEIVAEYTGRPMFADDFYDICLKMLKYYNALANYEQVNKGIYTFFRNKFALEYLCDVPQVLKSMGLAKDGYGNTSKGTSPNKFVNAWARRLQRDWMLSVYKGTEDDPIPNLRMIRSIGYIKEAIAWNPDLINADRVSSMGMLMILRAELSNIEHTIEDDSNSLADDPFFQNNYFNNSQKQRLAIQNNELIIN